MASGQPVPKPPLEAFLEQYWKDRDAGTLRELRDYLGLFRGDERGIAAEFLSLQRGGTVLPEDGGRIGPYRILRELGRGGQATVYLAEDTSLGRKVALKVLEGLGPIQEDVLARFRREALAASRLQHPGICAVFEAKVDARIPYIAMQYVEGETLARKIAAGRDEAEGRTPSTIVHLGEIAVAPDPSAPQDPTPTPSGPTTRVEIMRVVQLVEEVARALHVAHEAGVIHRDIKPGNLMVTPQGHPVVLDFGLAREADSGLQTLTRTGDIFGTPAYMSPEQIAAHRIKLDRRTDVWSLGVVLYECLCSARPFNAPTREGLYQAILSKEPANLRSINPAIPFDLWVVVQTSLDKDRDRRYQSAQDLADDLRRVQVYEPIKARPVPALVRLRRWAQRNPVVATASGSILFILVGGLALTLALLDVARRERDDKELALRSVRTERDARQAALVELEAANQNLTRERDEKDQAREDLSRALDSLKVEEQAKDEALKEARKKLLELARAQDQTTRALTRSAEQAEAFLRESSQLFEMTLDLVISLGHSDRAIELLSEAAEKWRKIKNPEGIGRMELFRGIALAAKSRHDEALKVFSEARTHLGKATDHAFLCRESVHRARSLARLGRFEEATKGFEEARNSAQVRGDWRQGTAAVVEHADLFLERGRAKEARALLDHWNDVLPKQWVVKGSVSSREVSPDYGWLLELEYGRILAKLGDPAAALIRLRNAESGLAGSNPAERGALFRARAESESALRLLAQAAESYLEASAAFAREGDAPTAALMLLRRAEVLDAPEMRQESLDALREAVPAASTANDAATSAAISLRLGGLLFEAGRIQEAGESYSAAVAPAMAAGDVVTGATVLLGQASIHLARGEKSAARALLEQAMKTAVSAVKDPRGPDLLLTVAGLFEGSVARESALEALGAAENGFQVFGDDQGLSISALFRARLIARVDPHAALDLVERSARLADAVADTGLRALADSVRGELLLSLGGTAEGLASWSRAADTLETHLLPGLFDDPMHRQVVGLLHPVPLAGLEAPHVFARAASHPDAVALAWRISELRRTHEWLRALGGWKSLVDSGSQQWLLRQTARALGELSGDELRMDRLQRPASAETASERKERLTGLQRLATVIQNARRRCGTLIKALRHEGSGAGTRHLPRPTSLAEVQSRLPSGDALLSYSSEAGDAFAFVLTSGTSTVIPLGPVEAVRQIMQAAREVLLGQTDRTIPDFKARALRAAGQRVLDPVIAALPADGSITTIVLCPSDLLECVPIESLLLGEPPVGATEAGWPFLITRFRVTGTFPDVDREEPAGTGRSARAPSSGIAVFGPREPDDGASGEERRVVAGRLLEMLATCGLDESDAARARAGATQPWESNAALSIAGDRFRYVQGHLASERNLREWLEDGRTGILHLGCALETDPLSEFSARLRLAGNPDSTEATMDGILRVRDICSLRLAGEVIAIDPTGLRTSPRIDRGTDMLAKAFLAAGARAVLTGWSTWAGPTGSEILAPYFRRFRQSATDPVESLAELKRRAILSGVPVEAWSAVKVWSRTGGGR